jgi:hypothetical protein
MELGGNSWIPISILGLRLLRSFLIKNQSETTISKYHEILNPLSPFVTLTGDGDTTQLASSLTLHSLLFCHPHPFMLSLSWNDGKAHGMPAAVGLPDPAYCGPT